MLDAIVAADAAALARLLDGVPGVDLRDEDGTPLILLAADSGDLDLVRPFLDAGTPVDTVHERHGWTPLISAVHAGDVAAPLVAELIARGADVNRLVTDDGETALTLAVGGELAAPASAGIVGMLIRAGADPDRPRGDGWTPLMLAAQGGDPAVVRALLEAGADVSASKGEGITAVSVAEHWGRHEVLDLLRAAGAADPVAESVERLRRIWDAIGAWFAENVPDHVPPGDDAGVSTADIAAACAEIGHPLPAGVRAQLLLYGATGDLRIFEYSVLPLHRVLDRWRMLNTLRAEGAFDTAVPAEVPVGSDEVECVWWSPGWLPFAEDGGGNLYCVDLIPPPNGHRGQVIAWEVHGGPTMPMAPSLEDYLRRYRDKLTSGRYRYHEPSGTFDEL